MAQARLEWPFGFAWRCAIVARSLRRRLSCGIISRADATLWPIGSGSDERGPMDGTASALLFPASMFRPGLPLPIHENAGVPRPRKARREIGNYPLSSGGNLSAAIFAAAIKLRLFRFWRFRDCQKERQGSFADVRLRKYLCRFFGCRRKFYVHVKPPFVSASRHTPAPVRAPRP